MNSESNSPEQDRPEQDRADQQAETQDFASFLQRRRSVLAKNIATDPIIDTSIIDTLLECGLRVPDHGALKPWKIVVIDKQAGAWLGTTILAPNFAAKHSDATEVMLAAERRRFVRAGVILAVISCPVASVNITQWEMHLSAGAICMNILSAALAMGYAAQWLTEWPAYDEDLLAALGGRVGNDKIAGFVYIGNKTTEPTPRRRPDPTAFATWLQVPDANN